MICFNHLRLSAIICFVLFSGCYQKPPLTTAEIRGSLSSLATDTIYKDTIYALHILDSLTRLPACDAAGFYYAGQAFRNYGDPKYSILAFRKCLEKDYGSEESVMKMQFENYRDLKEIDSARVYAEKKLAYTLDTNVYNFDIVQLFYESALWDSSIKYCDQGIAQWKEHRIVRKGLFYEYKVLCLENLGRTDDALECAKKFVPAYYEPMSKYTVTDE